MAALQLILKQSKTTPGTVVFKDMAATDHALSIYLTKDQVKEIGAGDMIKVTIDKAQ